MNKPFPSSPYGGRFALKEKNSRGLAMKKMGSYGPDALSTDLIVASPYKSTCCATHGWGIGASKAHERRGNLLGRKNKFGFVSFGRVTPRLGYSVYFRKPVVIVGVNDTEKRKAFLLVSHGNKKDSIDSHKFVRFDDRLDPKSNREQYFHKNVLTSPNWDLADMSNWRITENDRDKIEDFLASNEKAKKILK